MAVRWDCPQLTIETLKRETGVTDEQLTGKVDKTVFYKLAGMFDNWEKYVETPGLELLPGEKADLRKTASRHSNAMAVYRALELWQRRNPFVTYHSLLNILLELREGSLADQVCRIIAQTPLPTLKTSTAMTDPDHGVNVATAVVNPDKCTETTTNKGSSIIAGHVEHFESRFITLRTRALDEITAKGTTVKELRQRLMTLPSSISSQNKEFIKENYSQFKQAESIEDIFLHLNFYLSYIDFSLLEHIIKQFCSETLNKEMTRYVEDMRQFRSETTIEEILPHLPEAQNSPKDYSELEVKVNFDISTATLEEIDQFRKTFAKSFKLSELLLYLSSLKKSSLLVTWLVPASLGEKLKQIIHEKDSTFLLKIDILKLSINGESLYPPRAEAQASGSSIMLISETMLKGATLEEMEEIDTQTAESGDHVIQERKLSTPASGEVAELGPPPGELRPPPTLKWRTGKDMPIKMGDHVQSVAINDAVFVGGGNANSDYDPHNCVVMKFDSQQNRWTTLPQYTFKWFAMTLINNELLVAGGCDPNTNKRTNQVSVFQSGKWTFPYPPMNIARNSSIAVSFSGYMIVVGGWGNQYRPISSVEVLDVTTKRWYTTQSLPEPRSGMKSTLIENTLYLMGGCDHTYFSTKMVHYVDLNKFIVKVASHQDTSTLWQTTQDTLLEESAPLRVGRSLFTVGGKDDSGKSSSSIYLYQPDSRRWVKVGDLPTARDDCTCSVLLSGEVIIAGGRADFAHVHLNTVDFLSTT